MSLITTQQIIHDCTDCPHYVKEDAGANVECRYVCRHSDGESFTDNEVHLCSEVFDKTPEWCPLGLGLFVW